MTSPLVRAWLAARINDIAGTCCDIWYSFRPDRNEFWDTVPYKFRPVDVPVPAGSAVAAGTLPGAVTVTLGSPPPALNPRWRPWQRQWTMRICRKDLGGCGAGINERCLTADGKVTSPHKIRRLP